MAKLLIHGGHIIDPSQHLDITGDVLIKDGKIVSVGDTRNTALHDADIILDASGMVVSPGFIDLHCHLRQPGFEDAETIATGTLAAARGGFTTVCCMPNTYPPLDDRASVDYVKQLAAAEGYVRVLPVGCITKGRRGAELVEMDELARAGVIGFSDDGEPVASTRTMRLAMEYASRLGLPIIEHCEDKGLSQGGVMNEGWVSARLGLRGIPAAAEEIMVARDINLAALTGCRLHIAHVSTAGSVKLIRDAKKKDIPVTAEVTPHHLLLTEERVMGKTTGSNTLAFYDTSAKVNPPLRTCTDIKALVEGIKDGTIDAIATDHAPHTLVDKLCEFDVAAFGISGLETAFGCLMSLVHNKQINLMVLISQLTCKPARIIGTKYGELGTLKTGTPADITLFDPNREWLVDSSNFASKGKNTPFDGELLKGKVMVTIVQGEIVHKDEDIRVKRRSRA